jgi:hypothetical protein
MRYVLSMLLWPLLAMTLMAQNGVPQNAGGRGAGLANADLALTDVNTIFVNQAGLGFLENLSFSAYGETRFLGATGINSFLVGVAYPHEKIGTFGLSMHYFGYGPYNEQKIGLAYARKLSKRFAIGAQFDYIGTRIAEYGSAHSFTFELVILAKVTKHFHLAAHVFSPVRVQLPNGENIPSVFKLGGVYLPSKKVRISAQIEKDLEQAFVGRFGIEYHPMQVLYVRAGVSTSPSLASFGLGLNMKGLKIDVATSYHLALGFTPSLGVSYVVGEKQPEKLPAE